MFDDLLGVLLAQLAFLRLLDDILAFFEVFREFKVGTCSHDVINEVLKLFKGQIDVQKQLDFHLLFPGACLQLENDLHIPVFGVQAVGGQVLEHVLHFDYLALVPFISGNIAEFVTN